MWSLFPSSRGGSGGRAGLGLVLSLHACSSKRLHATTSSQFFPNNPCSLQCQPSVTHALRGRRCSRATGT